MSFALTRAMPDSAFFIATIVLCTGLFAGVTDNTTTSTVNARSAPMPPADDRNTAIFAGGSFWFLESTFGRLTGVLDVVSGYTGGTEANPTFEDVLQGGTGHLCAVQVAFDPETIRYQELVEVFWRSIDPTDGDGQFTDRGKQFMSAIFVAGETQRAVAEESKAQLVESKRFRGTIVTPILAASPFYPAEEPLQDFYQTNPREYTLRVRRSGREMFLNNAWGADREYKPTSVTRLPTKKSRMKKYSKPSDTVLKKRLTRLQYKVTQSEATERAFNNEYWNNERAGIYVDIVSGEPLFSSKDKFKSGTGWPSFTKPLVADNVVERIDRGLFATRTEVRSKHGDSHLGHVFGDGPAPTGLRYCVNSASLRFIPAIELEAKGYGEFRGEFDSARNQRSK